MGDVDTELRAAIAAVEGRQGGLTGHSVHLHQLDGVRTEAMVYFDAAGARVDWVHGKGDCAVTGEGSAILEVLLGTGDADALERDGHLVLYGDRGLVRALPEAFAAGSDSRG